MCRVHAACRMPRQDFGQDSSSVLAFFGQLTMLCGGGEVRVGGGGSAGGGAGGAGAAGGSLGCYDACIEGRALGRTVHGTE